MRERWNRIGMLKSGVNKHLFLSYLLDFIKLILLQKVQVVEQRKLPQMKTSTDHWTEEWESVHFAD